MIQSMTGYGKSVLQLPTKKISIEVKSLNSKNLDLNTRMPSMYREKELAIRKLIASKLVRGKIDFSLYIEITGEEISTQINKTVVKQYIKQLSLEKIQQYRLDEGQMMEDDFIGRVNIISNLLDAVIAMDPDRIDGVRERLTKGVADIKEKVDENRFEQELVYYIEKFDITEEKVRLKNHLEYFQKALKSDDSNGKKLGFISQEMGREINTIGSKSNHAPMQKLVVQMKDELEKIKEQLLNVL
jgi:uncharacterized protein YicC (UPF0701 family)